MSQFGYSLAMHRELGEDMLLVGAPRAQTDQPGVEAGGALYKCPLSTVPFSAGECYQLPLDPHGNDLENGEQITNKSGQMFGATVQSGGPDAPVVVCRPLYTWYMQSDPSSDPQIKPVGGCIIARRNFSLVREYTPCKNPAARRTWACQLGLSAAATKDEILLGAVGSFHAQGQVHILSFFDEFDALSSWPPNNLENSDYKGYSVSFGDFDADGYKEYIIGTPRGAYNRGTVTIMDAALNELAVFEGSQMGEYFGHTLASSDFNGDGFDDLVVASPMYSDQHDNSLHYDVGRVSVYQTDAEAMRFLPPLVLIGQRPGARFGFSLAALGDINQDGFNDLAIGAPHDGETGMGRVYIYHSSGGQGLPESPSQVLDPATLGHNWPTFGFSMSGGLDMDRNGYPDLVVGMYKASSVALFHSRPVIDINAGLSADITGITLTEPSYRLSGSGLLVFGFNVTLCLSYSGRYTPASIVLDYDLVADAALAVTQRCYFELIDQVNVDTIRNQVFLDEDTELCLTHVAYMTPSIVDKVTPISFRADIRLSDERLNSTRTRSSTIEPILNDRVPASATLTVPILRNCENEICVPDLNLAVTKNVEVLYVGDRKNVVMVAVITNRGEDAYQSRLRIQSPPEFLFKKAEQLHQDFPSTCTNDVQLSVVTCNVGNPLPSGGKIKLRVEFENVNLSGQADAITFTLDVSSIEAELQHKRKDNRVEINIPVEVMASINLVGLSTPERVIFDPEEYPRDREIETEEDIGPEIRHYYSLINKGPSHIGQTVVNIDWPLFTHDGNVLLLLTRASMNNGKACTVNAFVNPVDLPLESRVVFEETYQERDRSHCLNTTGGVLTVPPLNQHGFLPPHRLECCSLQNCVTITCRLDSLLAASSAKADLVISIRSRLLINTLHEGNYSDVTISSHASAMTKGSYYDIPYRQRPSAEGSVTTNVFLATDDVEISITIPFWIYIVAACAGLFIVIILILILWKIGFFKRKKITPEQRRKMERSDTSGSDKYDSSKQRCRTVPPK
ncbi:integrin alpha-8-like [Diadema setosum]|uniref:integrin alpha-8-like n=1 Tax=Diadema setosum TaxID=31175 RepID=UPI003B3A8487